jgi:hypothetical protein
MASGTQSLRTFRYPGGRYWTVCVDMHLSDGGPPALRFTAGARIIELATWPAEWTDYTDAQLVDLLRWAAPRSERRPPPPGVPRRRWDDLPDRES